MPISERSQRRVEKVESAYGIQPGDMERSQAPSPRFQLPYGDRFSHVPTDLLAIVSEPPPCCLRARASMNILIIYHK